MPGVAVHVNPLRGQRSGRTPCDLVNSIQIRAGVLSKAEVAALGESAAGGIPVLIEVETRPAICFALVDNQFVLNWALAVAGYTLQSTTDLGPGNWNAVTGVANDSKLLAATPGSQFFRLVN